MGGACGAPRLLGIYLISKMHTTTIKKIQKACIKTYEEDVQIYKDIENSQGQGAFFLQTPVSCFFKLLRFLADPLSFLSMSATADRLGAMMRTDGDQNAKQNVCVSIVILKSEEEIRVL